MKNFFVCMCFCLFLGWTTSAFALVTSGNVTIRSSGGTYSSWSAFWNDLGNLTGDLTVVVADESFTETTAPSSVTEQLNGYTLTVTAETFPTTTDATTGPRFTCNYTGTFLPLAARGPGTVIIEGITYIEGSSRSSQVYNFSMTTTSYTMIFRRNIVKGGGYQLYFSAAITGQFYNNILYNSASQFFDWRSAQAAGSFFSNNTMADGSGYGLRMWSNNVQLVENNLLAGTSGATGIWMAPAAAEGNNNSCYDSTCVDTNWASGVNNRTSKTADPFQNRASDDYRLTAGSDPVDNGKNLSAYFTTDFFGNTRSGTWDIGAVEYFVSPPVSIYRSVGTTATNLNTSGRTVTISGTTATFSGAMPNNVGVGDALVYGSTYIAFISGRTSDTVYTVQSAAGGTPTAASGASVGVYRSFNSLANWEANTTANSNINAAVRSSVLMSSLDLVTAGNIMMVPCYADGVITTRVTVGGWTTGASNYIKIYTPVSSSEVGVSQRHSGVWNDSAFRIEATMATSFSSTIDLDDDYVWLDGLQIKVNNATYEDTYAVRIYGNGYEKVSNCIVVGNNPNNVLYSYGILTDGATGPNYFWNNIIYGFAGQATDAGFCLWNPTAGQYQYAYNNTVIDCAIGIDASSSALVVAKNNIIKGSGNTATYTGTYATGTDYNSTDSTDTPGVGSNNLTSQTFTFKDAANKDFHLLSTDTGAKDRGISLSADAYLPFSVDIDGTTRPVDAAWDIGADECTLLGSRRKIMIVM